MGEVEEDKWGADVNRVEVEDDVDDDGGGLGERVSGGVVEGGGERKRTPGIARGIGVGGNDDDDADDADDAVA